VILECPMVDFVYIDGNHSSPQVNRDIMNSWAKIKPGGIMGGHDYTEQYPDVILAVKEFASLYNLTVHLSGTTDTDQAVSWWIQKPIA